MLSTLPKKRSELAGFPTSLKSFPSVLRLNTPAMRLAISSLQARIVS
jgi:hypothetical protein